MKTRKIFIVALIIILGLNAFVLSMAVSELPSYASIDNPTNNYVKNYYVEEGVDDFGGYNLVANILVGYRIYDTFGEIIVLFSAVMAILATLKFIRD